MSEYDFLNSLKIKIIELKRKRDDMASGIMHERIGMQQLDEQINQLMREKQRIQFQIEDKDNQIRKYDELIRQSEDALNKMMSSSQKLNDALSNALGGL